jgi:hypothetical protein
MQKKRQKRAQFKVQSQSFVRMFRVGDKEKVICESAHDRTLALLDNTR